MFGLSNPWLSITWVALFALYFTMFVTAITEAEFEESIATTAMAVLGLWHLAISIYYFSQGGSQNYFWASFSLLFALGWAFGAYLSVTGFPNLYGVTYWQALSRSRHRHPETSKGPKVDQG